MLVYTIYLDNGETIEVDIKEEILYKKPIYEALKSSLDYAIGRIGHKGIYRIVPHPPEMIKKGIING